MNLQNQYNQDGGIDRRNESFPHAEKPPTKEERKNKIVIWVWRFAFTVVPLIAGLLFYNIGILPLLEEKEGARWIETPCKILECKMESRYSHRSRGPGYSYRIAIRYSYEWQGKKMTGDRYNFFTAWDHDDVSKQKIVRANPKGKKTVCYVNPDVPMKSVLVREAFFNKNQFFIPLAIAIPFVIVFPYLLILTFVRKELFLGRTRERFLREHQAAAKELAPRKLDIKYFSVAYFLRGIIAIPAYFGMAFCLMFVLNEGYGFQRIAKFEDIVDFGIVFVLLIVASVGVWMVVQAILAISASFGSKISVAMKPCIQLGETTNLHWEIAGDPQKIALLEIELQCVKMTLIKGEHGGLAENSLGKIPLLQWRGPLANSAGVVSLTIPPNAPVSQHTEDKYKRPVEIVWHVFVKIRTKGLPAQRWRFGFFVGAPPPPTATPTS